MPQTHKILRVTSATVSAVVLVGASSFFALGYGNSIFSSGNDATKSATSIHQVAQQESSLYCPSRMELADDADYGDEDFQASVGNLQSASRMAVMGALYNAQMQTFDGAQPQQLVSSTQDNMTDSSVKVQSLDGSQAASLTTQTLKPKALTGAAGATASWATQGDLQGISASNCVSFATEQSFFVPSSETGWSNQLVLANSSEKSTTVTLTAYGTQTSQALALSTRATVTVNARSQEIVDLSAALGAQDGAFVNIESKNAPVAGVIRAVHMDGLNPQGSDYIQPLNAAQTRQVIPVIGGAQSSKLYMYSAQPAQVTLTFVGEHGQGTRKSVRVAASRVYSEGIDIPSDAKAVYVTSTSALQAMIMSETADNNGQADFSLVNAQDGHHAYAFASVENADTQLEMTNMLSTAQKAHVRAYDKDGKMLNKRDISVPAMSVFSIDLTSVSADAAFVTLQQDSTSTPAFVTGASLSVKDVNDAHTQARATLTLPSMDTSMAQYNVTQKNTILN